MDSTRDNPIIRFTTFWWALGVFLIFALLLAVILVSFSSKSESLEEPRGKERYQTKIKVDTAQLASLSDESITAAIGVVALQLLNSKPAAVEVASQVIPGSATAKKLANAPAVDTSTIDVAAVGNDPIDPSAMAAGKISYMLCGACHGVNGEGTPIAPPLAGSEWVTGPISNLIRIQLRGLQGAITVAGKEYNYPGGMAALSYQTDEQVAHVLTYIRNSFGNKGTAVKAEQVALLRSEVGKPQVTAGELIKP